MLKIGYKTRFALLIGGCAAMGVVLGGLSQHIFGFTGITLSPGSIGAGAGGFIGAVLVNVFKSGT